MTIPAAGEDAIYDSTLARQWFVACTSRELSQQVLARSIMNRQLALFRVNGVPIALDDSCPHRNAPLSAGRVSGTCLQCPYHGWKFDREGTCVDRPGVVTAVSTAPSVESFRTYEYQGLVWVLLDRSQSGTPAARPWGDTGAYTKFHWVDRVNASFSDALENLLDGTHTPFVHSGLVRSSSKPRQLAATVRIRNGILEAEYEDNGRQAGWISQLFERDRTNSFGRFIPPCLAELEYRSSSGTEFVLNCHFTPESPGWLRVYSTIYLRKTWVPNLVKRWLLTPFLRRVLHQDRWILQLQQQSITRQGGPRFQLWEGDLMRGWIDHWLRTGILPDQQLELRVDLLL